MARDGSGTYSLPANTAAVSGDPISSTKFNTLVQDLEADANVDRPIAAGGTGSSTALGALTNLFSGASPGGADKIGGWDQSASAFAFFSLGTGLSFNGTTIELDGDLSTIAGLTVAADNFIVGNSGGTAWEVKTPANARTSLGLGTAALKNTGTSGDAVPLLNVANTWSATQTISGAGLKWATTSTTSADPGFHMTNSSARLDRILNTSSGLYIGVDALGTERTLTLSTGGVLATGGNTVWHAGNDGAGSGLDADTVDGVQASALAQLAAQNVFTGAEQSIRATNALMDVYVRTGSSETGNPTLQLRTDSRYDDIRNTTSGLELRVNTTGTPKSVLLDTNGGWQAPISSSSETSGTLTAASANKQITAAGGITIPASVFAAGDMILIDGGGTARTITRGSGLTMYKAGSDSATATLAANGVMGVRFRSATVCVLTGDVT